MKTSPCPLCESRDRHPFWYRETYPASGGSVVSLERADTISWLPLEISLCLNCYHIYQSRPPDPALIESFYTGSYINSNSSPALGGKPPRGLNDFFRLIQESVGSPRGKAMEIGAADGYFLHLLEQDGWSPTGFEPSELGEIGKQAFNLDIRREFYAPGDTGESWNLVVSRYVFEHLSSPHQMLAGIFSEMVSGGWLALEVPDMQTRLREGILGSFTHEHISYFIPATFRKLVEEAGFEVKRMANSPFGLALIAPKPLTASSSTKICASEVQRLNQDLIARFNRRRQAQREKFARELSCWPGPCNFVIYGSDSHTTDLLVDRWLSSEQVSLIVDDDPAKQGQVIAGLSIPIGSRDQLPEPDQALIVLSAFGHHDQLWENLSDWRSRGGAVMRFYPDCLIVAPESKTNPRT